MLQFQPNFHILGAHMPIPFTDLGQILQKTSTHGLHLQVKFRLNWLILSPAGDKKRQILLFFWTSAFRGVANWQHMKNVNNYKLYAQLQIGFCTPLPSQRNRVHNLCHSKV